MTKLRKIPIEDNGEPLVDPLLLTPRLRMAPVHPRFGDLSRSPYVRQSVGRMLRDAAESLASGLTLRIVQGWRSLEQQRYFYEEVKKDLAAQHPAWGNAPLYRALNQLVAPPDDASPPPHSTGGAVDIYIADIDGNQLDSTSPFEWDAASAPTALPGLSETARANRQLLIGVLSSVGMTNYAGEWWHWSYGDQGWALRTGAPKALYGPVSKPTS